MKKIWIIAILFIASFIFSTDVYAKEASPQLYTAYNFWYEKPQGLWSINYKKGEMIPAGTKVKDVVIKRKAVIFSTYDHDTNFKINFTAKYHPGLSIKEFKERAFTEKNLKQLTAGFTEKELECVKDGILLTGIDKKAVLVSYGYPPKHVTSSLKQNTWTYWINRFKTKKIYFDDSGHTTRQAPLRDDAL